MGRGKRAATVGAGLSLLVHAGVLGALAHRPHVSAMPELAPPSVTIDFETTAVVDEPAPAPAAPAPARTKGRATIRTAARRPLPVLAPPAPEPEMPSVTAPEGDDPGEAEPDEEQAGPAPAVTASVPVEQPAPPTKAPVIAPDTARALRVYDTYPMLLAQASVSRAEILVEVCVSDHGQVSDAVIAEGGMAAFDHTLRAAIRSWRYRPLLVNGAPTPFCHFMRIKYALN